MTIRVLIVDDSALVREVLTQMLGKVPDIEVMGAAFDPIFAMQQMKKSWPDVIILDIEMPRMDGLTFLRKIMSERPTPVIICSSLTEEGASHYPGCHGCRSHLHHHQARGRHQKLPAAIGQRVDSGDPYRRQRQAAQPAARPTSSAGFTPASQTHRRCHALCPRQSGSNFKTTDRIIALGTSTGGTQALEYLLTRLPVTCPGLAIVQHMPGRFTASFAERLERRFPRSKSKRRPPAIACCPGWR